MFLFGDGDLAKYKDLRRMIVDSHDYTFTEQDLIHDRTLMLIVARAHENAWADLEGEASEDVFHNETSTAAAPTEKRDSPARSRDGKGRVEKAAKVKAPAKKPRSLASLASHERCQRE